MLRTMRVEYPGAIYHVMDRGDRREDIFLDDVDRQELLKTLAEACQAFLKSFWLLGIWDRGRHNCWRFFWSTLLRRPGQLRCAIELAVICQMALEN